MGRLVGFLRLLPFMGTLAVASIATGFPFHPATAVAQPASVSGEFRTALEPYGSFRHTRRWGDVWVPARMSRDWRPYTVGRWVYSDDYGWYWVSEEREASWGWVTYHYGRWVRDEDGAWAWIPGTEWAPAWVGWRHGRGHLGWAPLPPDDLVVEVRDDPEYWTFVRPNDFLSDRISTVVVRSEPDIFRDTIVVNETVNVSDRRFGVNPGIEPAYIAADIGRPIPAYTVQPRVLAGTADIQGAVQVSAQDLRSDQFRQSIARESNVRQSTNTIRPADNVPQPTPLGANERGRLGQNPPRAAAATQQSPQQQQATPPASQQTRPGTTGVTPSDPRQQGTAPTQQQQGTAPTQQQQQGRTGATPSEQQQQQQRQRGQTGDQRQGTTSAPTEQRQQGTEQRPQGTEPGRPQQGRTGATPSEQQQQRQGSQRGDQQQGKTGATPSEQRPQRGEQGREQGQSREQGQKSAAPTERQPQRGERGREQGTSGATPSEQRPQRGERGREQGPAGAGPSEQRSQRGERGREQGTSGATPSEQRPQRGERGREQGPAGAGPSEERSPRTERSAPQGTTGSAPSEQRAPRGERGGRPGGDGPSAQPAQRGGERGGAQQGPSGHSEQRPDR